MQLLEMLTLPALEELRVSECCFTPNPVVTIRNLLAQSGCPIHTLPIAIEERNPRSLITAQNCQLMETSPAGLRRVNLIRRGRRMKALRGAAARPPIRMAESP